VTATERITNIVVRTLFRIILKVDTTPLRKIPPRGPGILLSNHVSILEGPLLYVFLKARRATALGKIELWQNPLTRFFMQTWDIIPLHRGAVDGQAMRRCLAALAEGQYVGIAAEGTRSRSGKLQKGQPGAPLLATRANVPIYPIAHWGLHNVATNLRRLRRTRVSIRVGRPFYLRKPGDGTITRSDRSVMVEEMMFQLAILLPEHLRGRYSELSQMTTDYIEYAQHS